MMSDPKDDPDLMHMAIRDNGDSLRYAMGIDKNHMRDVVKWPMFPATIPKTASPNSLGEAGAYKLLAMRMRVPEGSKLPFEHLSMHVTDTAAFVFLVTKGKPVTIEDDASLFPSDQLITQLRLLIG